MEQLKIEYLPIGDLKPYEQNARQHGEPDVEAIAASIREFGFDDPIGIWGDENLIVEGHGRLLAAERLNMKQVPVIRLDHLTDEQRRAYALAHNKTAELSGWNFATLDSELAQIAEIDMSLFGFDVSVLEPEPEIVDDEIPERVETRCKLGDLWQLGGHRLICGDSTDVLILEKLLSGENAKLLLTDPPYGISVVRNNEVGGSGELHFKGATKGKVRGNYFVESREYFPVIGDETTETARDNYAISGGLSENQIIFGGNYFTDFLPPSRCWIVWDKQNTGLFADAELAWTSFDKGVKLYRYLWNGLCREGSREIEGKTRVHPTQKPVGMLAAILKDFSKENDTVLDCFGGSGSTLIACEQLNRKCFMAELDPHYCDVIIERWEKFTGNKAVLLAE